MSFPREPLSAKLVVGILFGDTGVHTPALEALTAHFGPADFASEPEPFDYTTYYNEEMGPEIHRQMVSFLELVRPETLADIKILTNQIEKRFLADRKRRVNLDPGILSEERFILATGKNYTHRIYLRNGIYADLTLIYQKGSYQALPWTYPDYRNPRLIHFLSILRQKLVFQRSGKLPRKYSRKGDNP